MAEVYENKVAKKIIELLRVADLDYNWIVFSTMDKGTGAQRRMYDLCMAFIEHWAWRYRNGHTEIGSVMYPICQHCHYMLAAVEAEQEQAL